MQSRHLRKQWVLNLERDRCRTFFFIVSHMIDANANWIAPHELCPIRLQQFGRRTRIQHSRIEPQIVAIRIKNDWHAVMDG